MWDTHASRLPDCSSWDLETLTVIIVIGMTTDDQINMLDRDMQGNNGKIHQFKGAPMLSAGIML